MPTSPSRTKAIRASRVIGADVYMRSGEKIGHVEDIVLDKTADRIMFAILARAGALVAVDNYYQISWSDLDYDEAKAGYVLPYAIDDLDAMPAGSAVSELTEAAGAGAR